jgi:hypothetical protein
MSKCPSGFSLSGTVPGPRNVKMSDQASSLSGTVPGPRNVEMSIRLSLSGTVLPPRNVKMSIRPFFVKNCPGSLKCQYVHQAFLCQELSRILEMSKCPIRLFFVRNCPCS